MTPAGDQLVDLVQPNQDPDHEVDLCLNASSFLGPKSHLCEASENLQMPDAAGKLLYVLNELEALDVTQLHRYAVLRLCGDRKSARAVLMAQVSFLVAGLRAVINVANGEKTALRAAAEAYDKAWPVRQRYGAPDATGDQEFDGGFAGDKWSSGGSLGYWIARHWYAENHDNGFTPKLYGTAATPVLFAELNGQAGVIGRLDVELFAGAGPLIPDPFSLGLTLLSRGKDGFHKSLQRAWSRSGLSERGLHARWRILPYRGENADALAVPVLHGRSLEAAVCCAVWAANRGIPGEAEEKDAELDERGVVTAMFEDPTPGEKLKDAKLLQVGGLSPKLESVQRSAEKHAGVDLVVVVDDRDIDPACRSQDSRVRVETKKTIGKAFEELLAMNKYVRAYQQAQREEFTKEFYFPPEEETQGEQAEPAAGS